MSTEFHLANTPAGVAHRTLAANPTIFRFISGRPAPGAAAGHTGLSDLLSLFSLPSSLFSIAIRAFIGLSLRVFLKDAIALASLAKVSFAEGRA